MEPPPQRQQLASAVRPQSMPASSAAQTSELPRSYSEQEAKDSHELLWAIEHRSVADVRSFLAQIRDSEKSVLTAPSLAAEHFQRTPFMAAADRGDLSIFTALLHSFNRFYPNESSAKGDADDYPHNERERKMRAQLTMQDGKGMTLAMLAARKGNVSILSTVLAEIQHNKSTRPLQASDFDEKTLLLHAASAGSSPVLQVVLRALELAFENDCWGIGPHLTKKSCNGMNILMWAAVAGDAMALRTLVHAVRRACHPQTVRRLLYQTDADGMNFLMHSVACSPREPTPVKVTTAGIGSFRVPSRGGVVPESDYRVQITRASSTGASSLALSDTVVPPPDPGVPVFNVAAELIKTYLWKGQLRDHLIAKDLSGRSLLVHAVRSGHCQRFDAALRALREDVLDTEIEELLDTAEEELAHTPIRLALVEAGKEMQKTFEQRRRQVKKDTSQKARLSTIEAKIQSFIPGKLIVIFQLLLPVISDDGGLYLLLTMCALAPVFNWANALLRKEKPLSENPATTPTTSIVSFLLGAPALFFWGIGTSDIGLTFDWTPSRSAAALAVATIVIPAIDAFFSSESVHLWYEQWSCQKQRFVSQVERKWRRRQKNTPEGGFDMIPMRQHEVAEIPRHGDAPAFQDPWRSPPPKASVQNMRSENSMPFERVSLVQAGRGTTTTRLGSFHTLTPTKESLTKRERKSTEEFLKESPKG